MGCLRRVGFGGGCHWCTEGVFQSLAGVHHVEQGWISAPNLDYSEGAIVHFDSDVITMEDLILVHLLTHSSTANHSMREKYRSAVYSFDEVQMQVVQGLIVAIGKEEEQEYITESLLFEGFRASKLECQNYYITQPEAPFCQRYIHPKIELARQLLNCKKDREPLK